MAEYEKYLDEDVRHTEYSISITRLAKEILTLRSMLWLNHGHKGMYGDDGEMQCGECASAYGFWDWKRTPIDEIQSRMTEANLKKLAGQTLFGRPIIFTNDLGTDRTILWAPFELGDFTAYTRKLTIIRCCDSPDIISNQDNTGYICPNCGRNQKVKKTRE